MNASPPESPSFQLSSRDELLIRLAHDEQGWFWSRFTALSAVHAALFVLLSVDAPGGLSTDVVAVTGLVLAAAWVYIQRMSLWYVDRFKREYWAVLERAGLTLAKPRYLLLSSTRVGFLTSLVVLAAWVAILILRVNGGG